MNEKKILIALICSLLFALGCEEVNLDLAADAGLDAIKAVALSDEEVTRLAALASRQSDARHRIAPPQSRYARRLRRLVGPRLQEGEHRFDVRVYITPQVNAFAMADGTIRINSGLMELMDDGELLFVVGHEMGHVTARHIKKKIMLAYAGSALRKGVASHNSGVGDIARSSLGGLVEKLLNAQYSQKEEKEADDEGVKYLKERGYDPASAITALNKLAARGGGNSILSSHPAAESRARRLQEQPDSPSTAAPSTSLLAGAGGWIRTVLRVVLDLLG